MREIKITPSVTNRHEDHLSKYFSEISHIQLIDAEEEIKLAHKIRDGDEAALNRLISANLRFVVSCAKKYQNNGLSLGDLINEGNLGLMKAARTFDETRGFKFISYAVWWIRQSIMKALNDNVRSVRIPMNIIVSKDIIKKEAVRLTQELERDPTIYEIAEVIEKTPEHVADMMANTQNNVHLDDGIPGHGEDETSLLNYLHDPTGEELTYTWIEDNYTHNRVSSLLGRLTLREQKVLKLHYGIGGEAFSDSALADEIGLSIERTRQIRIAAIKKLRRWEMG